MFLTLFTESICYKSISIILKTLQSECSRILSFGKITIKNKSDEIIRVSLIPAVNWNYHEQRTNKTLVRNPDKTFGGNHIL